MLWLKINQKYDYNIVVVLFFGKFFNMILSIGIDSFVATKSDEHEI